MLKEKELVLRQSSSKFKWHGKRFSKNPAVIAIQLLTIDPSAFNLRWKHLPHNLCLFMVRPYLESNFSLYLPIQFLSSTELIYLGSILLGGITAGFIPAIKAYRNSLQDGLTIQVWSEKKIVWSLLATMSTQTNGLQPKLYHFFYLF